MSFAEMLGQAQVFLLIFARCVSLIFVSPLLSGQSVPSMAKVGLALFTSAVLLPWVAPLNYPVPDTGAYYAAIVLGEVLIGLTLGFILNVIYSAFQLAGQFFSLQMGFAASQVYDPLSQIQLPLVGQFLNLIGMFVFLSVKGLQKIFLVGIYRSFETINAYTFLERKDFLGELIISSLGTLFSQALIIALPIMGTLFLVSVSMGLLAKAAPQMNLLMLGFPINIMVAFMLLFLMLPSMVEAFERIIDFGWVQLYNLMGAAGEGI